MTAPTTTAPSVPVRLLLLAVAGAAVAVLLGVYAEAHDPTAEQPYTLFFSGTIQLKVWFATVAVVLAGRLTEQQITEVVDCTRTL